MPTTSVRRARRVYRSVADKALPTWELDVATDRPFGLWRVLVDAHSGEVLRALSTMVQALGSAYATNPKVSLVKQVELLGLAQAEQLTGSYADVQSCGYSGGKVTCERLAQPDQQGNYFYKPEEPKVTDPFSEVHAYYHVDAFHRWMASRFGFARLGSQRIAVTVNLHSVNSSGKKQGIANAFFGDINGDGVGDLSFGQGSKDFAYDADVIYHEFTHSAVDATSDLSAVVDKLGFNMMPAGLNEGFADLMSSAFTNDPKVGDYAGGSNGIRNLVGATLTCPKDLSGESHSDGLIWGRLNWAIREKVQNPHDWDAVIYKTMAAVGKHATFADASALLLKVAGATDPTMPRSPRPSSPRGACSTARASCRSGRARACAAISWGSPRCRPSRQSPGRCSTRSRCPRTRRSCGSTWWGWATAAPTWGPTSARVSPWTSSPRRTTSSRPTTWPRWC